MDTEELKKRKTPRAQGIDYNARAVFFITICTENRRCLLSHIANAALSEEKTSILTDSRGRLSLPPLSSEERSPDATVVLSEYGKIAVKYIKQLDAFYDHVSVLSYVIMPNHVHLLVSFSKDGRQEDGQSRTPVPTAVSRANSAYSQFVSTFKRFCNKEIGENIWQSRSFDHRIRDRRDYEEHLRYIQENPIKWAYDELYADGS